MTEEKLEIKQIRVGDVTYDIAVNGVDKVAGLDDRLNDIVAVAEGKTRTVLAATTSDAAGTLTSTIIPQLNSQEDSVSISNVRLVDGRVIIYTDNGEVVLDHTPKVGDIWLLLDSDVPDRWVTSFAQTGETSFYFSLQRLETKLEVSVDQLPPSKVVLDKDLYTYASIGKITGATNTSPKPVAKAGDSLEDVFTAVFGTQSDEEPSMTPSSYSLTCSQTTVTAGGGEYGTSVSSATPTITFTLSTSGGTASYGYKYKKADGTEEKVTGSQHFYYPIKKQNGADIKIILPSNKKAASSMVTEGDFVSASGNVLYCNFVNKKVSIQLSLSSGNVTTEDQTRYGSISAEVQFGKAQKENQLTTGSEITKWLTFKGEDAKTTNYYTRNDVSDSSSSYTISKGAIYTYYAATNNTSTPGVYNRNKTNAENLAEGNWVPLGSSSTTGISIPYNKGQYIWIASSSNYTGIKEYNESSGKYNAPALTTKTSNQTLVNKVGYTCSNKYYFYRLTQSRAATGSTKFELGNS